MRLTVAAGKVFKIAEDRSSSPPKLEVYASFGGLLMLLKACASTYGTSPERHLTCTYGVAQGEAVALKDLALDSRIYLLMKSMTWFSPLLAPTGD
jgi:hypothetical protein